MLQGWHLSRQNLLPLLLTIIKIKIKIKMKMKMKIKILLRSVECGSGGRWVKTLDVGDSGCDAIPFLSAARTP